MDAIDHLGAAYCPLTLGMAAAKGAKGEELGDAPLSATFKASPETEVLLKGDTVQFVGTGSQLDRDDDVIKAAGVKHDNWMSRPVILFSHDARQRIGRGSDVERKGRNWVITADYYPANISPLAAELKAMMEWNLENKALKDAGAAFSVGFRSLDAQFVRDRGGFDFNEIDVLEYSDVSLPANPAALLRAKGDGVAVDALCSWAETIRKELGDVRVNAEFGQKLIELIDPTKELVLVELTPDHAKHLTWDPPKEPIVPAKGELPEAVAGTNPAGLAWAAAKMGLSARKTKLLLEASGMKDLAAGILEVEAPAPPAPEPPTKATDWQDDLFVSTSQNGPPDPELVKEVAANSLTDEDLKQIFIDRHAAKTGRIPQL